MKSAVLFALCAFALFAQERPTKPPEQKPPGTQQPGPVPQQKTATTPAKETPLRFDVSAMDKTADPCADFYPVRLRQLDEEQSDPAGPVALGPLLRAGRAQSRSAPRHPRRGRQARSAAATPSRGRSAIITPPAWTRRASRPAASKPIEPELNRIAALKDKAQLAEEIAHLHRMRRRRAVRLQLGAGLQGLHAVIAQFDQGGLGLPDRDYYLKDDPESVEIRQKYVAHVQKMFELAGDEPRTRRRRTPTSSCASRPPRQGLARPRLAPRPGEGVPQDDGAGAGGARPGVPLERIFHATPARPQFTSINVSWPDFVKAVNARDSERRRSTTGRPICAGTCCTRRPPLLPAAFVNENFNFYGKTLTGATELRPRWKRCVGSHRQPAGRGARPASSSSGRSAPKARSAR